MSLKEKLLEESSTKLGAVTVELDSIFESVQLDEAVKANFETVFEQAVKARALALAESHIVEMAEGAEAQVAELVESEKAAVEAKLYEDADKFLTHLGKTWLAENKQAVKTSIQADLFESMVLGMKELFIENNISVPAEQTDVVAELNTALEESGAELKVQFDRALVLEAEIASLKKEKALQEATAKLTESQKEKVTSLVEGLSFGDAYTAKLAAVVEMVSGSTVVQVVESAEEINIDEAAAAVNFAPEVVEPEAKPKNTAMNAYLAAARNS